MAALQSTRERIKAALPEEVALESLPCPLGCSSGDDFVAMSRDRVNKLPGEFAIVRCRGCGLMRTDPRPTPETMGYYYPESYAPYESTRVDLAEQRDANRSKVRSGIKRLLDRVLKLHVDTIPALAPGRILEVGCASGVFLSRMARKGWAVEGMELSDKAASSARAAGYRVLNTSIENAPDPEHQYDLIVGWMVLEHFHDPVSALSRMHFWTRPGGWLAVSVPDAGSVGFRVFKDAWFHLHLPNHLYHYTPRTLSMVLAKAGWEIDRVFSQRDIGDLVASIGNRLTERGKFPRLAEKLSTFPAWQGRIYLALYPISYLFGALGHTGAMTVWAKRKDD